MISLAKETELFQYVNKPKEGAKAVTVLETTISVLEPTVFANVDPNMEVAQTEIFGPVLSILKFKDDSEAINISNGTDYGLVGGVFTKDLDRAMHCAQKVRAGQFFVNEWFDGGVETPFGGYVKSVYGREKEERGF